MAIYLIGLVRLLVNLVTYLVIAHVLLSYFMSPYHPVRETIDRAVRPLLAPIRQLLPQTGMMDFSPLVFLILVQLIGNLLVNFIYSF